MSLKSKTEVLQEGERDNNYLKQNKNVEVQILKVAELYSDIYFGTISKL